MRQSSPQKGPNMCTGSRKPPSLTVTVVSAPQQLQRPQMSHLQGAVTWCQLQCKCVHQLCELPPARQGTHTNSGKCKHY